MEIQQNDETMIKAILFDMDGVLLDSFEAWFRLFNKTLNHFGKKEITKKEFIDRAWSQDTGIAAKRFFKGKSIKDIASYYIANFMDYKDFVYKNKEVSSVLGKLKKKGIKIVVVSNTPHSLILKILNCAGLEINNLDLVVGGNDVKKGKPAPDMLLYACKKLKIKPKEAIVVGDSKYDMIAAKRAKCLAIGYKTKGDKKIESLNELLKLVR